jgi:hypothetical protein
MAIRQQYRSMQGKVVDLGQLISKNELTPAVGNTKVNARGDELGPGGKIVRTKEEIMAEYYKNRGNSLPDAVPNRAKTVPANKQIETTVPTPVPVEMAPAINDVAPDELDFNDPEPNPVSDITKRKRTS